jgi:hypothetical protein
MQKERIKTPIYPLLGIQTRLAKNSRNRFLRVSLYPIHIILTQMLSLRALINVNKHIIMSIINQKHGLHQCKKLILGHAF